VWGGAQKRKKTPYGSWHGKQKFPMAHERIYANNCVRTSSFFHDFHEFAFFQPLLYFSATGSNCRRIPLAHATNNTKKTVEVDGP
jgi:hypothetical protein